ncbi:MAG: response regulator [Nitrospira sp.]|nr:response regulator [Nitrospira sp.]
MNGNGKRVLVVNDDADAGLVVSRVLDEIGYNVLQVDDGAHALIELNKRRFDVVIADYPMLSICGMELLNHIHAHRLETPIILLSGMVTNIPPVDMRVRPFAWIRKPFEDNTLIDLVSSAAPVAARS